MATESAMAVPARVEQDFEPGDTPRYGVNANIENHPQVTDFVPRRYRVIAAFVVAPLAVGAALVWCRQQSTSVVEFLGIPTLATRLEAVLTGLVDWTSAVVMLLAAVAAMMVFSLRRYRVDDYRGRYRTWRFAALVGILASANAIAKVHSLVAAAGASALGQTYLPGGVGWWLLPVALVGGWVLFRIAFDAAECRAAFAAFSVSTILLSAAAVHTAGLAPASLEAQASTAAPIALLGGYVMVMAGCLLYARYVVLDVQGLIEHKDSSAESSRSAEPVAERVQPKQAAQVQISPAVPEDSSAWVDGSEPEDEESQNRPRKLSKAEKRRLRKRQANQRAA